MDLTMDKSVVVRFRRPGTFSLDVEYLRAYEADPNAAGSWVEQRAEAHEFFTQADAATWAKAHPYLGSDGQVRTGWALVVSSGEEQPRREDLPAVTKPPRPGDARRRGYVAPEEAAEMLEKRGLF